MKISVCIPAIDNGYGNSFLGRSLDVLSDQTYKNFEIVITDNSEGDGVERLCETYSWLPIKYYPNPRKGMAKNINESIQRATGDVIKFLFQDDYLASDHALADIAKNFKGDWLVTGCTHFDGVKYFDTHFPVYTGDIVKGNNRIGSPSVLTIKNKDPFFFDENMSWMLDCDYYRRLYDKHGDPAVLNSVNVVIGVGPHQTTSRLSNNDKQNELFYMLNKYS